jgi:hypothetical protein
MGIWFWKEWSCAAILWIGLKRCWEGGMGMVIGWETLDEAG